MANLSDWEKATRKTLRDDFLVYSEKALKIRTKSGKLEPFRLNAAQQYIHQKAEEQKAKTGMVRAIILKGRQQGCSTFISGRFYHQVTHNFGCKAFILTHEQSATDNLFEMANRYHQNCPEVLRPSVKSANAKELFFGELDSGYQVGTAGNKAVGRSSTIQLFHGSEAAYWPNAEEHTAGILQAVPREPNTEVWLESTSNGQNNFFHRAWQQAEAGDGDFIAIFVPWFWQPEYTILTDDEVSVNDDDLEYQRAYGLTHGQMLWRKRKIQELGGADDGINRFKREYPANPQEAFEQSNQNSIIPHHAAYAAARNNTPCNERIRPVWGFDVAGEGRDRSALCKRRANHLLEPIKIWQGVDATVLTGHIVEEYRSTPKSMRPFEICIDHVGIGYGIYCRLQELGIPVRGINVGKSAIDTSRFHILKDELWWKAREWFLSETCVIPNDLELIAELTTPLYSRSSDGRVFVEGKKPRMGLEGLFKRGFRSPDKADAFILSMAGADVEEESEKMDRYSRRLYEEKGSASWMTL